MPKLHLGMNLDEIPEFGVTIDSGRYRGRLVKVTTSKSRGSNKPMLVFVWKVQEGYDSEQPSKYKGVPLRSFATLTKDYLGQLKQHLRAFGVTGNVDDVNTDELLNKDAILIVGKGIIESRTTGEEVEVSQIQAVLPMDELESSAALVRAEVEGKEEPAVKPSAKPKAVTAKTVKAAPAKGAKGKGSIVPTAADIEINQDVQDEVESLFTEE